MSNRVLRSLALVAFFLCGLLPAAAQDAPPPPPLPSPAAPQEQVAPQEKATPETLKQETPPPDALKQEQPAPDALKQEKAAPDAGKKEKTAPEGTPVLWKEPGDIAARDMVAGPGGEAMRPDLSSVTFIEEETGGYSPKFRVRDGAGKIWVAKLGKEAQPETVAVRLVWAVGYVSEVSYLAPCVQVKGAPTPRKEVERCDGGKGFANVRFEARPDSVKRLDNWRWDDNPFAGTKEFQGLVILMALINNWDLKDSNNKVIYVPGEGGAPAELRYVISDLGATFGKTGNFITHNRNEPKDYVKSKFVERVEGDRVRFGYDGKNSGLFEHVKVEEAAWIGGLLSKLTDRQIEDAFRAANYGDTDVARLAAEVRERINELVGLAGPAPTSAEAKENSPAEK